MLLLFVAFLSWLIAQVKAETCSTVNGQTGECIGIEECPGLIDIFATYVKGTETFLGQFLCKNIKNVCCPAYWQTALYNKKLPDKIYCGKQRKDDRFSQMTDISIDEFPWLAALLATNKITDKEEIFCQGTLIHRRYVITAAHCISNRKYQVSTIRLGEFNIKNSTDCVAVRQYDTEDCSTTEEFGIEEIITHHFYSSETGQNDIALIRLNKNVEYTDYIRPICVPTFDMASVRDTLYATGWGEITTGGKSELKKKIRTAVITNESCQNMLNKFNAPITITSYNMCTLDDDNSKDFSCAGDGGGPIMFSYKHQWYLEGIISIGIGCGRNIPNVHTTAFRYLNWIKQNIRD